MNNDVILCISHDSRRSVDGGIVGFIHSVNNLIRDKVVYKAVYVENTRNSHVFAEPSYFFIKNKSGLLKKIEKLDIQKIIMSSSICESNSDFYEIIYTSGNCIRVLSEKLDPKLRKQLEDIIENNEYSGSTSEKYIDEAPILNYLDLNINSKLSFYNLMKSLIERKKKKEFLNYLSDDCKLFVDRTHSSVSGKSNVKKYINNYAGVFNQKIKYEIVTSIYGYTNKKGESDILIGVDHFHKGENSRKVICLNLDINDGKIYSVTIYNRENNKMKKLNDVALNYLEKNSLNEFDEDVSLNIKNNNLSYDEWLNANFQPSGTRTYSRDIMKK